MGENMNTNNQNFLNDNFNLSCNIPNFSQYKKDLIDYEFDKICMVRIETADTSIAFVGQDEYYLALKEVFENINYFLSLDKATKDLTIYFYDYKTFILASKTEKDNIEFIMIMRELHNKFQHSSSKSVHITGSGSFALVINQKDMVHTAYNVLYENSHKQDNFIICDTKEYLENKNNLDVKVIEILKYAIENDKIIPHYQGIIDNGTGKTIAYEALMRVVDEYGNIHMPYEFLDIAKKYKFFEKMTYSMITKVFNDFSDRKESISINVCVNDLESKCFRDWLYNKIVKFNEPKRIIVELLESEDSNYGDTIIAFTKKLQSLGARIAIDDFGAGYSTFSRVVNVKPEIIKIDGSIIQNILKDENCLIIIKAIVYFAESLNAVIIAEFVENEDIHKIVQLNSINYSQGYLFSKPAAYEEIENDC